MNTIIKPLLVARLLTISSLLCMCQPGQGTPFPPPSLTDQAQLASIHSAGMHGDRSVIPRIVAVLEYPNPTPVVIAKDLHLARLSQIDPLYTHTALRAAAQLHATEAMPQIEALISSTDPDARALSRVTKARILAEVAVQNIKDPKAQAATKVSRFFDALLMTSDDMNSDLAAYNKPTLDANRHEVIYMDWQPPVPVGVYAMREVADMMYQGDYRDYISLPAVAALDLKDDGPSMLKRRFARPLKTGRIAALVEDLSRRDPHGEYDAQEAYIMQLAADEEQAAAQAATDKLQQMEAHPDQYPLHGFYNMIDLVGYAGSKEQAARLEKLHDPRRAVAARYRLAVQDIVSGRRKIIVPGY